MKPVNISNTTINDSTKNKFQVLVVTVNQVNHSLLDKMNIQTNAISLKKYLTVNIRSLYKKPNQKKDKHLNEE